MKPVAQTLFIRLVTLLLRAGPLRRTLWRGWYNYLARRYPVEGWSCMNYGYAPLDGEPAMGLPLAPVEEDERYPLQLYHRVASAVPLAGRDILEVGSGRGGGAAYIQRHLGPAQTTAVDYSARAVELSRRRHGVAGLSFAVGDAEALPLDDASVDVVVNVESSHCYGAPGRFFAEVARVLRPGGHFSYADFRDASELGAWRAQLRSGSGLRVVDETDITPNVVAALEADDARKVALIDEVIPAALRPAFRDFAGVVGSVIYEAFKSGEMRYLHTVLEKGTS